eukprot:scaffold24487_cov41-Phaeocystis_antarctica.AAC.2
MVLPLCQSGVGAPPERVAQTRPEASPPRRPGQQAVPPPRQHFEHAARRRGVPDVIELAEARLVRVGVRVGVGVGVRVGELKHTAERMPHVIWGSYLLPTTYYLLPTTYYLLLTTYYLPPRGCRK